MGWPLGYGCGGSLAAFAAKLRTHAREVPPFMWATMLLALLKGSLFIVCGGLIRPYPGMLGVLTAHEKARIGVDTGIAT